jgi:SAM-dependent methyltransferase
MVKLNVTINCPCRKNNIIVKFRYNEKPKNETEFGIAKEDYRRNYDQCLICGHFFSDIEESLAPNYSNNYSSSTYGDTLKENFDRILTLPIERSDNEARIQRIKTFLLNSDTNRLKPKLLDIGSGLGVFPYVAIREGWTCTSVDPDPQVASHLREIKNLDVICSDFLECQISQQFDIITLNKVIEHIAQPASFLEKAKSCLKKDGFVYIEVPDGEASAIEGQSREEFFIEHLHVFSVQSLSLLITHSGLHVKQTQRMREPSGKYTIACFVGK